MENIERIEQIINEWKAKSKRYKEMNFYRNHQSCEDTVLGLHLALDVIKGPSNTQMHVDEDPCACNQDRKEMIKEGFSFCHWCGRGFHQ